MSNERKIATEVLKRHNYDVDAAMAEILQSGTDDDVKLYLIKRSLEEIKQTRSYLRVLETGRVAASVSRSPS